MIKLIFRFFAYIMLIFTILFATIDAANIVATSNFTLTTLDETLTSLFQWAGVDIYGHLQQSLANVFLNAFGKIVLIPTVFAFGLIYIIFYMIGYKSKH